MENLALGYVSNENVAQAFSVLIKLSIDAKFSTTNFYRFSFIKCLFHRLNDFTNSLNHNTKALKLNTFMEIVGNIYIYLCSRVGLIYYNLLQKL